LRFNGKEKKLRSNFYRSLQTVVVVVVVVAAAAAAAAAVAV